MTRDKCFSANINKTLWSASAETQLADRHTLIISNYAGIPFI